MASGFPEGIPAPALRALSGAGYTQLEQLAGISERELAALHGMGPKALALLKDALAARGLFLGVRPLVGGAGGGGRGAD